MENLFEHFLQDIFTKDCKCAGDKTYDSFENWISNLDTDELIQYANMAIDQIILICKFQHKENITINLKKTTYKNLYEKHNS